MEDNMRTYSFQIDDGDMIPIGSLSEKELNGAKKLLQSLHDHGHDVYMLDDLDHEIVYAEHRKKRKQSR